MERVFDVGHSEMVLVRDIPLYSVCEHHLLPFHGTAHVAYIPEPEGRVTGLSKVARLVDGYARRPQVQERLTAQAAMTLSWNLSSDSTRKAHRETRRDERSTGWKATSMRRPPF